MTKRILGILLLRGQQVSGSGEVRQGKRGNGETDQQNVNAVTVNQGKGAPSAAAFPKICGGIWKSAPGLTDEA